jgi:vesicular inhibitory amino acid transporter
MQLHITIAFAVIVSPAFYLLERMVLGMHKRKPEDEIEAIDYESANTPVIHDKSRASKGSVVSMADIERVEENDGGEAEAREYRGANAIKYVILRLVVVTILVVASVALKDHFLDLQDFIGASAVTMICIVLPIVFYLKKLWNKIPMYEKIPALVVVVVCFVLGCYVTYTSGKNLFNPDSTDPEILFPFCDADEQRQIYYNATA